MAEVSIDDHGCDLAFHPLDGGGDTRARTKRSSLKQNV